MQKIIAIVDVNSAEHTVRLDNGEVIRLAHGAIVPSVGDQVAQEVDGEWYALPPVPKSKPMTQESMESKPQVMGNILSGAVKKNGK